jgi:hypothetical protein
LFFRSLGVDDTRLFLVVVLRNTTEGACGSGVTVPRLVGLLVWLLLLRTTGARATRGVRRRGDVMSTTGTVVSIHGAAA